MKSKTIFLAIALMLTAGLPAAAQKYIPYNVETPQSYAPEAFQSKNTRPFQDTEIQQYTTPIYKSNSDGDLTGDPNGDGTALGDVPGVPVEDGLTLIVLLAIAYGIYQRRDAARLYKGNPTKLIC
jgi:hypothetical protein